MSKLLTLGSRSSVLAKIQTVSVGKRLQESFLNYDIRYHFQESKGDKDLVSPLWQLSGQGIFTKELQEALLANQVDGIVHSWKDLDLNDRPGTKVISVLPREDQRDVILFKKDLTESKEMIFLTSSPRREYNLRLFIRDCFPKPLSSRPIVFESVRGNIQTRIRKFLTMDVAGIIIAKAALDRMLNSETLDVEIPELKEIRNYLTESLRKCLFMVLPLSQNPNAPAQGAICVEVRENDYEIQKMVSTLTEKNTEDSVLKERAILKRYGGGCHQKIGVSILKKAYGEVFYQKGLTDDGVVLDEEGISDSTKLDFRKNQVWPPEIRKVKRSRTRLTAEIPEHKDLFITKEYALPTESNFNLNGQAIWTSGLATWRALAERGLWVNGTSDGLGEDEPINVDFLLGRKSNFIKLTHDQSNADSPFEAIATYHLSPPQLPENFQPEKIKAAFWSSGSEFEWMTQQFPELKNVIHFTGPGTTYQTVKKSFGESGVGKLHVCLSFDHWIKTNILAEI